MLDLTPMHKALHEFAGEWNVEQRIWSKPDSAPEILRGSTNCQVINDGLGTMMTTTIPNGVSGVGMMTYNVSAGLYQLSWSDTNCNQGMLTLDGYAKSAPSSPSVQKEFGGSAMQTRVWSTSLNMGSQHTHCLPDGTFLEEAREYQAVGAAKSKSSDTAVLEAPEIAKMATGVDLTLIENRVNPDLWVLEFYLSGYSAPPYVVQMNIFRRR